MAAPNCSTFDIEDFLQAEEEKDLLRFTTAGSVDDGKSTLIGRLLYDSKSVYEDQIKSVAKASVNRNAGPLDFSLLTDGLRAEREQGITIDVAYRQEVFEEIRSEFGEFLEKLDASHISFIPISALMGDNVVEPSRNMPWYHGPSLLEHLETVEVSSTAAHEPFRFPVQRVARPDHDFRGYAGQIASGTVRPGDEIAVVRTGRRSQIKTISTFGGNLDEAWAPMSVTLTLEDELDISRGDLLAAGSEPVGSRNFEATLVWMNERPLDLSRRYLIKHTTQLVPASIAAVRHRVNIESLDSEPAATLEMNQIGVVEIDALRPIFFDPYRLNHRTGSFVVIDAQTNATVGAGMIARQAAPRQDSAPQEQRRAVLNVWHDEAVDALRNAGFEVVIEP